MAQCNGNEIFTCINKVVVRKIAVPIAYVQHHIRGLCFGTEDAILCQEQVPMCHPPLLCACVFVSHIRIIVLTLLLSCSGIIFYNQLLNGSLERQRIRKHSLKKQLNWVRQVQHIQ